MLYHHDHQGLKFSFPVNEESLKPRDDVSAFSIFVQALFTAANDWDYKEYYDSETIHIPHHRIIHPQEN